MIEIPKIIQPLKLSDYAPEFGDISIPVWVNPPKALLTKYLDCVNQSKSLVAELQKADTDHINEITANLERIGNDLLGWYSEIWSQTDTQYPVESVKNLVAGAQDTDPAFWEWLTSGTLNMIAEHRTRAKKA